MSTARADSLAPYARELGRLADGGVAGAAHLAHARELGESLAALHGVRHPSPGDAYWAGACRVFEGPNGLGASLDALCRRDRLRPHEALALETRAVAWRWRLRDRSARLCGLADADPRTLDYPSGRVAASGHRGEAAHDLARVAVYYLSLGIDDGAAWERSFRPLWNDFFRAYFAISGDAELLDVAPLYFAGEALALASSASLRRNAATSLVRFATATLAGDAFDPDAVEGFVER